MIAGSRPTGQIVESLEVEKAMRTPNIIGTPLVEENKVILTRLF